MLKFRTFHFLVNELPGTGGGDKYSLSHTFESTSHKRIFKPPLIKHLHRLYSVFIQGFPSLISCSFHHCRAEAPGTPLFYLKAEAGLCPTQDPCLVPIPCQGPVLACRPRAPLPHPLCSLPAGDGSLKDSRNCGPGLHSHRSYF